MKNRVCGILIKNDKILLIKYKYKNESPLYHIPGGGVEKNESKKEALIREFKEELNINVTIPSESPVTEFYSKRKNDNKLVYHTVFIVSNNSDHNITLQKKFSSGDKFCWVKIKEITNYRIYPNISIMIENISLGRKYGNIDNIIAA